MGQSNKYKSRLKQIKNYFEFINFGELYEEREIFEDLLRVPNTDIFIKDNYDEFNNVRDRCELLIHTSLDNEERERIFKLGVAVAQYQLKIISNDSIAGIKKAIILIKWLVTELLELKSFQKLYEEEVITFIEEKYVPITVKDVLELKEKIIGWIS